MKLHARAKNPLLFCHNMTRDSYIEPTLSLREVRSFYENTCKPNLHQETACCPTSPHGFTVHTSQGDTVQCCENT